MKHLHLLRSLCLVVALAAGLTASAQADGPVGVAVNIKAVDLVWGTGGGDIEFDIAAMNDPAAVTGSPSTTATGTAQLTAQLEPGKTYFLNITSHNLGYLTIQALAPAGYVMEIDRVPRERRLLEPGSHSSVRIRVLAPFQEYSGRGGTATRLASGRVLWQASMGSLANGSSAGAIAIIDTGTTAPLASLFTPASVLYEHTSSEVEVVYRPDTHPNYPGTVHQILAPEVCAEIFYLTLQEAQIKFYHRSQLLTSPSTGVRQFVGDPFAWYLINPEGAQPNKIKIQCDLRDNATIDAVGDPDQTKYTVLERSGTAPNFTWKAEDWYEGANSVSRDERVRNNGVEAITIKDPTITNPDLSIATQATRTYGSVPWGEEIVSETRGTTAAVTTGYDYYTTSAQSGSYGRLKSVTMTGGAWEAYEYYEYGPGTEDVAGALHRRYRPFLTPVDTSVPADLSTHSGEITTFEYALDAFARRSRPASVVTTIGGTITASSTTSYIDALVGFANHPSLYLVTATRVDSVAAAVGQVAAVNLTTVIKFFREDAGATTTNPVPTDDFYRMQLHSIQTPDGRKQSFVYQRGTWAGGSAFTLSGHGGADYGEASRISVINGTTGTAYSLHEGYSLDALSLIEDKSTMSVTIRDKYARICRTESRVWHSNDWKLLSAVDYEYNLSNQLTKRTSTPGGIYQTDWSGEHQLWEKDEAGVKTTVSARDAAGRIKTATREGLGAIAALDTRYTYDAEHRVTEVRTGAVGGENLVTSRHFDQAGRVDSATSPGVGATGYSYSPGGRSRTVTLPGGAQRTETRHTDGKLASVVGSATVEEHYTYEILAGGIRYLRVNIGSPTSTRLGETWSDRLGRPTKTSRPSWPGEQPFIEENTYASTTGLLFKTKASGYAPTRYEYDALGQLTRSGLDIDDNGLDPNSTDRITDSDQKFQYDGASWWLRSETKTYPYANGNPVTLSLTRTRLTGHLEGQLEEIQSTDAEGNVTTQVVDVVRNDKAITVTTTQTGLGNQEEKILNGLPVSSKGPDGRIFTTQYDALLRVQSITDPRTAIGATTTTYKSGTTLPSSVSASAGLLYTCDYDGRGRKILHSDAAGKNTRYEYNSRGQLLHQWGDGAYPVEYGYDPELGDQTSLSTYRGALAADSTVWPAVGTADTTNLVYDKPTGLLKKKSDAANEFTEYTYNQHGQTHQRFWARTVVGGAHNGERVTSTYAYNDSTGELSGVSYNDGTPAVGYEYTRLGQLQKATDGITGERNFSYTTGKPWRLDKVALSGFYGDRVFTALYETGGITGRARGFQLGTAGSSNADLEQAYGYNLGGRFETLDTRRAGNATSRIFRYGYHQDSSLVQFMSIDGDHPFTVTRDHEEHRDLLTAITSKWGGTTRTHFEYHYNNLYQRDVARQSGDAFADYGQASFSRYTYNPRGELTAAPGYLGAVDADTSQPLPGRQHSYDYDSIGNRKSTDRTGNANLKESYRGEDDEPQASANKLNQYRKKENKTVPVQGTAEVGSSLSLSDGTAPSRQGRYWAAEVALGNSAAPAQGTIIVQGAKITSGGADFTRTDARPAQIAQALQAFSYDKDGNMTSDGVWDYQWDAENRLYRQATTGLAITAGLPNRVLEFRYDFVGRRVQKRVFDGATSAEISSRRYLYNGWDVIAEFEAPGGSSLGTLVRSYTWGLDIAGSLGATGGVGALVQIYDHTLNLSLLPTYDGNGNLASLVNGESGAIEAAYEYDPFGQLLRAEGNYAGKNPFRFSTKFTDTETSLVYYGHRYYAPGLGRFINRDPIEEAGGLNLYGFCGNDGINNTDYLGQVVRILIRMNGDWYYDPFDYFPWDDFGGGGGGISFGPRLGNDTAPAGPLARMASTHAAIRGRSPYDSRRFIFAADGFGDALWDRAGDMGIRGAQAAQRFDEGVWLWFLDFPTAYENAKEGIQDFSDLQRSVIDRITEKIWFGAYEAPIESYITYEALTEAISDIGWDDAPDAAFELGVTLVGGRLVRAGAGETGARVIKITAKQLKELGFQEHHIIHQALKAHKLLKLADFDIESRANKIFLPDDPALHPERSIHKGSHLKSVKTNLADQMDAAVKRGRAEGWTTEQYREELLRIIREERGALRMGDRALNVHRKPWADK